MFLKFLKTGIIIIIVIIVTTHCLIIYMAIALVQGLVAKILLVLLTRANLTKNPSPRIDPGESPADAGWNGKRGTTSRKKTKQTRSR